MHFDTKVSGIPCRCKVTNHHPYKHMKVSGSGYGDADAPEYEEFEFDILDRKGYKAPWLQKKVSAKDADRLLEEYRLEKLGERYGYL